MSADAEGPCLCSSGHDKSSCLSWPQSRCPRRPSDTWEPQQSSLREGMPRLSAKDNHVAVILCTREPVQAAAAQFWLRDGSGMILRAVLCQLHSGRSSLAPGQQGCEGSTQTRVVPGSMDSLSKGDLESAILPRELLGKYTSFSRALQCCAQGACRWPHWLPRVVTLWQDLQTQSNCGLLGVARVNMLHSHGRA